MALDTDQGDDLIGAPVTYRRHPEATPERGIVTDVRGVLVMVRFGYDTTPKATHRDKLELATEKVAADA